MAKNQRALRTKFAALLFTLNIPVALGACAFHASGSAKSSADAKSESNAKSDANAKADASARIGHQNTRMAVFSISGRRRR